MIYSSPISLFPNWCGAGIIPRPSMTILKIKHCWFLFFLLSGKFCSLGWLYFLPADNWIWTQTKTIGQRDSWLVMLGLLLSEYGLLLCLFLGYALQKINELLSFSQSLSKCIIFYRLSCLWSWYAALREGNSIIEKSSYCSLHFSYISELWPTTPIQNNCREVSSQHFIEVWFILCKALKPKPQQPNQ